MAKARTRRDRAPPKDAKFVGIGAAVAVAVGAVAFLGIGPTSSPPPLAVRGAGSPGAPLPIGEPVAQATASAVSRVFPSVPPGWSWEGFPAVAHPIADHFITTIAIGARYGYRDDGSDWVPTVVGTLRSNLAMVVEAVTPETHDRETLLRDLRLIDRWLVARQAEARGSG